MIDYKFSDTIRLVFREAALVAKRLGNSYVDSRHIFIALYTVHQGVAYSVMLKSGLRAEDFQKLAAIIREQTIELQPLDFVGGYGRYRVDAYIYPARYE